MRIAEFWSCAHLCVSAQDWITFQKELKAAVLSFWGTSPLAPRSSRWPSASLALTGTPWYKDVHWHGDHIQEKAGKEGRRGCNIQNYRFGPGERLFSSSFCSILVSQLKLKLKFEFLASPSKFHCLTECSEVLSTELCGCWKLEIRGVYVVITDYWVILAASYYQQGLCLLVLNTLFHFSQNDNGAF